MTYTCEICHDINSNHRFTCKSCGTIPAKYSVIRKPTKLFDKTEYSANNFSLVSVVVAHGADRVEYHHTSRSYMRTVPLDYYAEA